MSTRVKAFAKTRNSAASMSALAVSLQMASKNLKGFAGAVTSLGKSRTTPTETPSTSLSGPEQFKADRRQTNTQGRARNILARLKYKLTGDDAKKAKFINSLTNWQNHQWMMEGAPKNLAQLSHFASLGRG